MWSYVESVWKRDRVEYARPEEHDPESEESKPSHRRKRGLVIAGRVPWAIHSLARPWSTGYLAN
jgi:hypothetical protein